MGSGNAGKIYFANLTSRSRLCAVKQMYKDMDASDFYHEVYIAPELIEGAIFSTEADIYSLGIIVAHAARRCGIKQLKKLAHACTNKAPSARPFGEKVIKRIEEIIRFNI